MHEELRRENGSGKERDAATFESANDRQKKRVVLAVAAATQKMIREKANGVQIGRLFPKKSGIEQADFMDFAGHRRVLDAATAKIPRRPTEFSETAPNEIVANFPQDRIGVIANAQTDDFATASFNRLRQQNRVTAPAGDHADATRFGREKKVGRRHERRPRA